MAWTVDEFANKIKLKYPDYADMDNQTLTDKMLAKYPDYKDDVITSPKESSMQKLGGGVGEFFRPHEIPGISKPVQTIADFVSRAAKAGEEKLGQFGAGRPTLEPLTTAGQGVLTGIRGVARLGAQFARPSVADVMTGFTASKVSIASRQTQALAKQLQLLKSAPAEIKAVEVAKLVQVKGKKAVEEAMTLAEVESEQTIAALNKSRLAQAAHNAPKPLPASWQSTERIPLGTAPGPSTTGKPFTLQAGLAEQNRAALEAFRAKLPQGPAMPPRIAQEAVLGPKPTIPPVPAPVVPIIKAGEGFAGNINLAKYPKPVADLITSANKATGVAERLPQTIEEMKAIGATPEFRGMTEKLATLPEGGVPGEFLNYREIVNKESKYVLDNLKPSLESGGKDIDDLLALNKKLENVSKVSKMSGQILRVHKEAADSKLAQQVFDIAEQRKQEALALNSPLTASIVDGLTQIQKKVLSGKFDLMQTSKLYRETLKKSEQAYRVYLNAILSNPYTHLRNTAGNLIFAGMKPFETAAAAGVEKVRSLLPGGVAPTHTFGEAAGQLKGAARFMGQALDPRNIGKGWLGNLQKGLPFDVRQAGHRLDTELASPISGKVGKVVDIPLTLLKIEDDIGKSLIGQMEYAGLKARGLTGEALKAGTMKEAAYRTFQEESGPIVNALIAIRDTVPGANLVVPFVKTPTQLVARGAERSPLGFLKMIGQQAKYGKNYTQADYSMDMGRAVLGSSAGAFLAWQYGKGKISGAYPTDKDERTRWQAEGKTEWSYKHKGRWLPLSKIEPVGSVVKIAIAGMDVWKNKKGEMLVEQAATLAYRLGRDLGAQSSLNGFNTLAQALSEPDRKLGKVVSNVVTGFIPGASKFVTDIIDPTLRAKGGIIETAKSKIPGLSQTLPPQRDILGAPIKKDMWWGTKATATPELDFAKSLDINLPDTRTITQPITRLTTFEENQYRALVGEDMKRLLQYEMRNPSFANPEQERKYIEGQISDIVDEKKGIISTKAEFRNLGISFNPDLAQATDIYTTVIRDKDYKSASQDQKRAMMNRFILLKQRGE